MNLTLRGLPDVRILRRNVLTTALERGERAELGLPLDGYDVVLANPPFSGKVDRDRIVEEVKVGTTTRDRAAVPEVHAGQPEAGRAMRRNRAGGRAVRLDRRPQGAAAAAGRGQHGRGRAVAAGRRLPALCRREDLGAAVQEGRAAPSACCSFTPMPMATSSTPTTTLRSRPTTCRRLLEVFQARIGHWSGMAAARRPDSPGTRSGGSRPTDELAEPTSTSPPRAGGRRAREQVEHRDPMNLLDELKAIEAEIAEELDALTDRLRQKTLDDRADGLLVRLADIQRSPPSGRTPTPEHTRLQESRLWDVA